MPTLLILDDEEDIAQICALAGEKAGFQTKFTSDFFEFKTLIEEKEPDVILLDIVMPKVEGMEILQWLSNIHGKSHIIIMSGYGDKYLEPAQKYAEKSGLKFAARLQKPFQFAALREILRNIGNEYVPREKLPES